MAEQKFDFVSEDGLRADAKDLDAMLRREAMDRLVAASGEDVPQSPDDDVLFDYLSGRLEEADEETVRDWLVADPEVTRRLGDLQDLMAVEVPGESSGHKDEHAPWEARLAWNDLQDRLSRDHESAVGTWGKTVWTGLAAAVLLMVGGSVGWWMGSSPESREPRGVQAITLQLLRDGEPSLPAGRNISLSMPLNVPQGSCETLDWVLWRDGVEVQRLELTPQDGQLHLYLPPIEAGIYRIDIEDCHGGRQSLEVQLEE